MFKFIVFSFALLAAACQGSDGTDGKDGASTGVDGMNGLPGAQGPAGRDGAPGTPGATGMNGADGSQGPVGPAGAKGEPGARGDAGPQGPAGPQGAQGVAGPAGPQGIPGTTGPQGATGPKGDPGSFMAAQILTCSQQSKVTTSDGRVIVRYWAKVDDSKINTNSIALAGAYICGRTTAPMGQDICKQPGVTCVGDPNPWPDCQTTPVNIVQGQIWVSCGVQDQQNGVDINTDKFTTAHIMYKLGS